MRTMADFRGMRVLHITAYKCKYSLMRKRVTTLAVQWLSFIGFVGWLVWSAYDDDFNLSGFVFSVKPCVMMVMFVITITNSLALILVIISNPGLVLNN